MDPMYTQQKHKQDSVKCEQQSWQSHYSQNLSPANCGARGPWSCVSSSSSSVDLQPVSSLQSPFSILFRLHLTQESLTASACESGSLSTHEFGPHGTFVGVYDGHGGPETLRYITDHLFQHLKRFPTEQQSMSVDVI